jgi:hypothetical protein
MIIFSPLLLAQKKSGYVSLFFIAVEKLIIISLSAHFFSPFVVR